MASNGQRFYTHEFFDQYPNIEDNTMQEQVQNIRQFLEQVPLADRMGFLNSLRSYVNQQRDEMVEANMPPDITQGMTSLINAVNQVANEIGNNGHNHGQPAHEQGNGGEHGLL